MPGAYTDLTVVAGNTIQAAWGNLVRDSVVNAFASRAARNSAISSPVEGMVAYITGDNILTVYDGTNWVQITPESASVETSESTSSTSFTDLSTAGPAVTIETGTKALVTFSSQVNQAASQSAYLAIAVSGATTVAATEYTRTGFGASTQLYTYAARSVKITGLTAGENTFTMKYRVDGGTLSFANRDIAVVGLL